MFLGQAAQFLASVVPWPEPGSWTDTPPFFVNIHAKSTWKDEQGKDRTGFPGRACTTVEEALNQIQYRMKDGGTDLYVCMSAQREGKLKEGVSKTGRPWKYWTAKRSTSNALWHKSLFIDVDVKDTSYKTPDEAFEAFGKFRRAVELPLPDPVVMSGSGGFHAHWTLPEPIDTPTWLTLSDQLVGAMLHHEFVVDYGVTTDACRLLRIPGTFNYKHSPPKPVYLL